MRIRELELEEGRTTAFTDGSGLENKAAGGFCANPNSLEKEQPDLSGDQYLGTKATHFDGEPERIALALEGHNNMKMVAFLSGCKPAIRVVEKLDSETEAP